jgi:RNA polymerase primary sigma factor
MQQFKSYQQATKHKLLTKEEEVDLAQKMEKGDKWAREKLITSNLRLAISEANKFRNSNVPMEDLIQESHIGLIRAVDRFDWRRGFRFSTYAVWWIKQSVRRYVNGSSHVKFPSGSRNLIWKINNVRREYEKEFSVYPTNEEIAEILGEPVNTVANLRSGMQWPINLDSPIGGEDGSRTFGETIEDTDAKDPSEALDQQKLLSLIHGVLENLSPQEERVLRLRFGITEKENNIQNFPSNQYKGVR